MRHVLEQLGRCRRGVTAVEYGLIAGLISIAAVVMLSAIGGRTGGFWTNISTLYPNLQS